MSFSEFIRICHSLKKLSPRDCVLSRKINSLIKEQKLDLSGLKIFEEKFSGRIKRDLQKCPNIVVTKFLLGKIHKCIICKKYIYKTNITCSRLCQGQYANKVRERNTLKKYGVKNVFQLESVKEKSKLTMLKKFGVEYSSQRGDEYIQKRSNTLMKHYGVTCPNGTLQNKQKLSNLYIKRNLKLEHLSDDQMWNYISCIVKKYIHDGKFDFTSFCDEIECSVHSARRILGKLGLDNLIPKRNFENSYPETFIFNSINDPNKILGDRSILEGKEIDILLPDLKLGIEFNGEYFHSIKFRDENYHLSKSEKCLDKNIQLFHVFEFDNYNIFLNKVRYYQNNLKTIGARKARICECELNRSISNFIERNATYSDSEFLAKCNNYKYLYYNDEILLLMGIVDGRCLIIPKCDVVVSGGLSKLLKNYSYRVLVNRNYSSGYSLRKLGYNLSEVISPFLVNGCYNTGYFEYTL